MRISDWSSTCALPISRPHRRHHALIELRPEIDRLGSVLLSIVVAPCDITRAPVLGRLVDEAAVHEQPLPVAVEIVVAAEVNAERAGDAGEAAPCQRRQRRLRPLAVGRASGRERVLPYG